MAGYAFYVLTFVGGGGAVVVVAVVVMLLFTYIAHAYYVQLIRFFS